MYGCLVALDKLPGVSPVGIGKTWHHIFAKYILKFMESEAPHACRDDQLCAGLKAVIDRMLHGVKYIWEANLTKEKWGFLLIYADNTFN